MKKTTLFLTAITIGMAWSVPTMAKAKVIHVKENATGAATGAGWADAFTSLQDGLAAAVAGDEIWVAAGIYKPDRGSGISRGNRNASFTLKENIALLGGFAGLESDPGARDWRKNKTILSGDLSGNDKPDFSNHGENSYRVIYATNLSAAALDGFIVTGGNGYSGYSGGGLVSIWAGLKVTNCIFTGNQAGSGGGVFSSGNPASPPSLFTNCIFSSNKAGSGGGVHTTGDQFINCIFLKNTANGSGGGLWLDRFDGQTVLRNTTFVGNAAQKGGGIYLGGIDSRGVSIVMDNSILWANSADSGPQVGMEAYSTLSVTHCDIQGGEGAIAHDATSRILVYANSIDASPMLTPDGHLLAGSPCIDAGDPETTLLFDFDNEVRPWGGGFDIGADEFTDSDGDGLADFWENTWFGNLDQTAAGDPDGDGLANSAEYQAGASPTNPDTDGDGFPDLREVQRGTDPTDPLDHPGVIYVDGRAAGNNDGTSWAHAHTRLQDALQRATPGYEVWVAAGTYAPDQGIGITPFDRNATFQLKRGVSLVGGFAGHESDPSQRDLLKNKTILSGDLFGNDGPDFTHYADNSLHVVTTTGTEATVVLDGLAITGGNAGEGFGGGMYISDASPRIVNTVFTRNRAHAGGAVFNHNANPTFANCILSHNAASDVGGAMAIFFSNPTVTHCTVVNNRAVTYGGGLYSFYCNLAVGNSLLWGNSAIHGPQIAHSYTGSLAVTHSDIQGSAPAIYLGEAGLTFQNNIDADPLLTTDFHLRAGSPCIDKGDPGSTVTGDIDGDARPQGAGFDMGADEYADRDGDGYSAVEGDCDDADGSINPTVVEVADGVDNNCNGYVDENPSMPDTDGDGFADHGDNCPAAANPDQADADGDGFGAACDCDDLDPAVNPNAAELPDGIDNNCDVRIDEGFTAPLAFDDAFAVRANRLDNILQVLANDFDPDTNDTLKIKATGAPSKGGVVENKGTHLTYSPPRDYVGAETFTYAVEDATGLSDTATVTVTISDVPVMEQWTRTRTTGLNNSLGGFIVDADGNGYITGADGTAKYDSDGNLLWVSSYGLQGHGGFHLTEQGNLFLGEYDAATKSVEIVKFSPDGSVAWRTTYKRNADGYEYVWGIDTDSLENVYVVVVFSSSAGTSYFIEKFNGDGVFQYALDPPFSPSGLVVDRSTDDFYVTGEKNLAKYNSDGILQWIDSSIASPRGLRIGPDGSVYLVCKDIDGADIITARYDAGGVKIWESVYSPTAAYGVDVKTLMVDPGGNVYVIGEEWTSTVTAGCLIYKYDPDGNLLGLDRYGSAQISFWGDITTDPQGNVYLVGGSGSAYGAKNQILVKYSPEGALKWSIVQPDIYSGSYVYVDAQGSIHTAGRIFGPPYGFLGGYGMTKYVQDLDGDGYFSHEDCNDADPATHPGAAETADGIDNDCDGLIDEGFRPPVAVNDVFDVHPEWTGVLLDVLANDSDPDVGDTLTITSVSAPSGGGTVIINNFYLTYTPPSGFTGRETLTYTIEDATGLTSSATVAISVRAFTVMELWRRTKITGSNNSLNDVVVDGNGNSYIAALDGLVKYGPDGTLLWSFQPVNVSISLRALSLTRQNNLYLVQYDQTASAVEVVKFSDEGTVLWRTSHKRDSDRFEYPVLLETDSLENVYVVVASAHTGGGFPGFFIAKFNGNGVFQYFIDPPFDPLALAVDKTTDALYAASNGRVAKYDGAGNLQWIDTSIGAPYKLFAHSNGQVYVLSKITGEPGIITTLFDGDGNKVWESVYASPAPYGVDISTLAVDVFGNVFVTGTEWSGTISAECLVYKYDPAGNLLWSDSFNKGLVDECDDIVTDAHGDAYLIGRTGYGEYDQLFLKYTADGIPEWDISHPVLDLGLRIFMDDHGGIYTAGTMFSKTEPIGGYGIVKYVQDLDGDAFFTHEDCNDADHSVNPGTIEICGDGIDNNCNDMIDDADPACAGTTLSSCTSCHAGRGSLVDCRNKSWRVHARKLWVDKATFDLAEKTYLGALCPSTPDNTGIPKDRTRKQRP